MRSIRLVCESALWLAMVLLPAVLVSLVALLWAVDWGSGLVRGSSGLVVVGAVLASLVAAVFSLVVVLGFVASVLRLVRRRLAVLSPGEAVFAVALPVAFTAVAGSSAVTGLLAVVLSLPALVRLVGFPLLVVGVLLLDRRLLRRLGLLTLG